MTNHLQESRSEIPSYLPHPFYITMVRGFLATKTNVERIHDFQPNQLDRLVYKLSEAAYQSSLNMLLNLVPENNLRYIEEKYGSILKSAWIGSQEACLELQNLSQNTSENSKKDVNKVSSVTFTLPDSHLPFYLATAGYLNRLPPDSLPFRVESILKKSEADNCSEVALLLRNETLETNSLVNSYVSVSSNLANQSIAAVNQLVNPFGEAMQRPLKQTEAIFETAITTVARKYPSLKISHEVDTM